MRPAEEGGTLGGGDYQLIGTVNTFRVNQNDTTTPIVILTARSKIYDVSYSWIVTRQTYLNSGPDVLAITKTGEVEGIVSHDHVQAFRSEAELNRSNLLYYYAIVTVGTDDLTVTDEVAIRMDQLQTPGAFAAINGAWDRLAAAGVTATSP